MGYRKLIFVAILCFSACFAKSQQTDYRTADSISYQAYLAGNWLELITYSNEVIRKGVDFPLLRQRIGYAYFMQGNYSASLRSWQKALESDSHNQDALLYAYLCNLLLNRTTEAMYIAARLEDSTLVFNKIKKTGISEATTEASLKFPELASRGGGTYLRAGLIAKLPRAVQLDQSLMFFNQAVNTFTTRQFEYYGKLSYPLNSRLVLLGAYHYLNTASAATVYNGYSGLAGLKLSRPFFDVQGDVMLSSLSGGNVQQYNGSLRIYPAGNFTVYSFTRASIVHQRGGSTTILGQLIGARVSPRLWLEGSGTFGGLENYYEADGLYLYNSIDNTSFKAGATAYFFSKGNTRFALNYSFERKRAYNQNIMYNQSAISGGITWKF